MDKIIANLEYYKVFCYVAKYESLTLAAEALSISQPAVSQSIKQLESVLCCKLFERTSRGVRLSAEGKVLISYVEKGYDQIALGEKKLTELLNMDFGELRIGASDMTLQFYLLPYLEKFHEQYPHIKVMVTNAPTPETLHNLQEEQIDFGVISTPCNLREEISTRSVKEIEDVFVAGRRFIQYKNRTLDLKTLEALPLICLEKKTSTRANMDSFLENNGVHVVPEFELATSDMVVQFALRNLGVGNVMREFASEYIKDGTLFELRFNKMFPKREIHVATNKRHTLSPAARKMLDLLYK